MIYDRATNTITRGDGTVVRNAGNPNLGFTDRLDWLDNPARHVDRYAKAHKGCVETLKRLLEAAQRGSTQEKFYFYPEEYRYLRDFWPGFLAPSPLSASVRLGQLAAGPVRYPDGYGGPREEETSHAA